MAKCGVVLYTREKELKETVWHNKLLPRHRWDDVSQKRARDVHAQRKGTGTMMEPNAWRNGVLLEAWSGRKQQDVRRGSTVTAALVARWNNECGVEMSEIPIEKIVV